MSENCYMTHKIQVEENTTRKYTIENYFACDTQIEFGRQLFDTAWWNNGKTERAIHWLPVPLAFNCMTREKRRR